MNTEYEAGKKDKLFRRFSKVNPQVVIVVIVAVVIIITGIKHNDFNGFSSGVNQEERLPNTTIGTKLPEYTGEAYSVIQEKPEFPDEDLFATSFTYFSEFDELGRCQFAKAVISKETLVTGNKDSVNSITPSGWNNNSVNTVFKKCELIDYSLTGEKTNERNLITGTKYLDTEGMSCFEEQIREYVKKTGNHVAYSVTPIYVDTELVARGVQIDAYSIEDTGEGICFSVYCYNVQPGVEIDYNTGKIIEN